MTIYDLKTGHAATVRNHAGGLDVLVVGGRDDAGPFAYGGYFGKRRITPENFVEGNTCIVTAMRAADPDFDKPAELARATVAHLDALIAA